jgi:hypothetical protein
MQQIDFGFMQSRKHNLCTRNWNVQQSGDRGSTVVNPALVPWKKLR